MTRLFSFFSNGRTVSASSVTAENPSAVAKDPGRRRDIPEWLATLSDKTIETTTSIPLDTGVYHSVSDHDSGPKLQRRHVRCGK